MTARIRSSTAIRFDVETHQALANAATERGVSVNFLVNMACREFVARLIPADQIKWTVDVGLDLQRHASGGSGLAHEFHCTHDGRVTTTTNPHMLTADEAREARAAFDAGRPWVKIVEGDEFVHAAAFMGRDALDRILQSEGDLPHWVAPRRWADLDKPCDTCEGVRRVYDREPDGEPCPDCRDGRQVWELRTVCPRCIGYGRISPDFGACAQCARPSATHGDGSVLVARVTVQVVPVVADIDDNPDPIACIEVAPNRECTYWPEGASEPGEEAPLGALDPMPVPGRDFGVVFREAT